LVGGDDAGMTLTETLITIVIMSIIILPLSNAAIDLIRVTDDTQKRLDESHDAQIPAAFFAQDVQSLGVHDWSAYPYALKQSVELNAPAASGLYPCGDASLPNAVVRLAWDDPTASTGAPQVDVAAYVVESGPDGEIQLHRLTCVGSTAVTGDVVVAHYLADTNPLVVTREDPSVCTSAAVPQSVTMNVAIHETGDPDATLIVTLTGQRRQT
jgi:prepilin-type N-terminal cleavage/methylation domain-containing protein